MDPRSPKNQSFQNQTKLVPLCMSHRTHLDHIMFSSNGHHMQNLSHSHQIPKQAKSQLVKVNADVSKMTSDFSMTS
jgi:hypothetical protein